MEFRVYVKRERDQAVSEQFTERGEGMVRSGELKYTGFLLAETGACLL